MTAYVGEGAAKQLDTVRIRPCRSGRSRFRPRSGNGAGTGRSRQRGALPGTRCLTGGPLPQRAGR